MKKMLAILLITTMLCAFSSCSRAEPSTSESLPSSSVEETKSPYLDGDYEVTFKTPATDRTVDAMKVTFLDGEMLITEYTCKEESADEASAAEATEAEVNARSAMNAILDAYERAGGVLEDMEPVDESGMEHFYRFQRMVRSLRSAAERGLTTKIYLDKFADGEYTVTAKDADENGYTHFIKAVVLNGGLTTVSFDGKNSAGNLLSQEQADTAKIYQAIGDSFLDSGDPTALVMPEGGQEATSLFVRLATPLVNAMTSGGAQEITAPNFIDGTYTAQFKDFDENGWKEIVVLNIYNDVVTIKSFDAMSKADPNVLRSQQAELDEKMKSATGTYTYSEAVLKLAEEFSKANNDVFAIDNVSGATVTTNNFKQLVNAILTTTARDGELKEPLEIDRVDSEKAGT